MIVYKVNVKTMLRDAGYNTTRIRKEKVIGENALQNFRKGKMVDWVTIDKLCAFFDKQVGDFVEYIPDDRYRLLYESGYFESKDIPVPPPKD